MWCRPGSTSHAASFRRRRGGLAAGGGGHHRGQQGPGDLRQLPEKKEKVKLEMFLEVAERASAQQTAEPAEPQCLLLAGLRAGPLPGHQRHQALARPRAARSKTALEMTIKLAPLHADAHIALGAFHAEVIDKVGKLLGKTRAPTPPPGSRCSNRP